MSDAERFKVYRNAGPFGRTETTAVHARDYDALRDWQRRAAALLDEADWKLTDEAADEIERLRKRVAELERHLTLASDEIDSLKRAINAAQS